MADSRDRILTDRPPGWAAWGVSLLVHGSLLAAVLLWVRPPVEAGPDEEAVREVGIALKRDSDDGPVYEQEDEQPTEQVANTQAALQAALPSAEEIPSSAAALPRLPTLAPGEKGKTASEGAVAKMAAGGKPSKRVGSKATTTVFGVSGTGTRFVYVFDRSISMAGAPLRAAKEQLVASLEPLESVHQFQVIFFNHEPQSWDLTGGQGRIAFATDANKRSAEKFIRSVVAAGGTFRRTALQLALRLRLDVIFFLTDTDDPMSARDLAVAIARARRDGIAINTIEYGSGNAPRGDNFLVRLARETNGRYVYVDTGGLGR